MANTGPTPISSGGQPATANPLNTPSGTSPRWAASPSSIRTTAEAPSRLLDAIETQAIEVAESQRDEARFPPVGCASCQSWRLSGGRGEAGAVVVGPDRLQTRVRRTRSCGIRKQTQNAISRGRHRRRSPCCTPYRSSKRLGAARAPSLERRSG